MSRKIFVNLPVKDLNKSVDFFTSLGFQFNKQFTDEKATCMIINENAFVMLLVQDFFKTFTPKGLSDTSQSVEVINALSSDSKEEVNEMVRKAIAAGGSLYKEAQDMGYMYYHAFQDLDGHLWEVIWMDPSAVNPE